MSRFNTSPKVSLETNHAGGPAVSLTNPNYILYTMVASNLVQNRFYESANDNIVKLRKAIRAADPIFVAKLAVYARNSLNLRTVPLILMVELAKIHSGTNLVSRGLFGSICRADELAETLAYYKLANGRNDLKRVSKQVIKGIQQAFLKFDEYQFSKYKGSNNSITLRDAMFITHPKPISDEQAALFHKIAQNTLGPANTWEAKKSSVGQDTKGMDVLEKSIVSAKVWEEMIESKALGYMATLRNLRNFTLDGISHKHVEMVCEYLINEKAVLNSKQFPFRFYIAFKELNALAGGTQFKPMMSFERDESLKGRNPDVWIAKKFMEAIKIAGVLSLKNLELFDSKDRVLSITDVSGSMGGTPLTQYSSVYPIEVAAFYCAMLHHLNPSCRMGYFGDTFGLEKNFSIDPFVLPTKHGELSRKYGHGTQPQEVFKILTKDKVVVDKLIVWSDMQFWGDSYSHSFMNAWNTYTSKIAPNCKLYLIDTVGYSKGMPVNMNGNVFMVNGFSAETFKLINSMCNVNSILKEIMEVNI